MTRPDEDVVPVTFPPGTWVHVFTGQQYDGGTSVVVEAPLGTPAAFVRQGDPVGEDIRTRLRQAGLT